MHNSNSKLHKQYLNKLLGLVNTPRAWAGFNEMLDDQIGSWQKKLEQVSDPVDIYKAQGAIQALRHLRYLRDEVHANQK